MPLNSWLDFKGALNSFYDEKLKITINQKSSEYKDLFQKHLDNFAHTQRSLIFIALAIFLLLLIAHFWPN